MNKTINYITLSVIIFACFFSWHGNYWSTKWFVLLAGLVVYFSYRVGSKTHLSFGLCLFYFLMNSLAGFAVTNTFSSSGGMNNLVIFGMAYSFVSTALFTFFISEADEKYSDTILNAILFFVIVNSFALIVQSFIFANVKDMKLFLGEMSMAGCIGGLFAPYLIHKLNGYWKYLVLVLVFAAVQVKSTTAIAVTFVSLSTYLFSFLIKRREFIVAKLASVLLCSVGVLLGYLTQGSLFFNSSGRFENQLEILKLTIKNMNYAFGYGGGSYFFMGPAIQKVLGHKELWQHPHSDFIKVIFEYGFVGLGLAIIVSVIALRKSYNKPWLFGMVCGVLFFSVVQYPSFLPVHSFICLLIVIRAIKQKVC